MNKIVVFNQKGGTGKSVSTVNIAGCLEKLTNNRVLVIDCDSQMNSTNYLLTQQNSDFQLDISHCIKKKNTIEDVAISFKNIARSKNSTNIFVVPGSKDIDTIKMNDVFVFKDLLTPVENKYEYCLFDCPPHISNATIAALSCADYIIVPALPDTDSLCGFDLLIDTINQIRDSNVNIKLKILGIFFNNVETTKALDNYIVNDCHENMGDTIFNTFIRRSSAISQARFYGKPINYYKQTAPVTKDYESLTREIIERIG